MDEPRASKRRKVSKTKKVLDEDDGTQTPESEPPATATGERSISKKQPRSSASSRKQTVPSSPTPQDLWRAAKSQSKGYKNRSAKPAESVDVYDDFDGAHVGLEPYGRLPKPAVQRGRRKKTTVVPVEEVEGRVMRDEDEEKEDVQNQHETDPLVGFFKRFVRSKGKSRSEETPEDRNGEDEGEGSAEDEEADDDNDDAIEVSQDRTPRSSGRPRQLPAKIRDDKVGAGKEASVSKKTKLAPKQEIEVHEEVGRDSLTPSGKSKGTASVRSSEKKTKETPASGHAKPPVRTPREAKALHGSKANRTAIPDGDVGKPNVLHSEVEMRDFEIDSGQTLAVDIQFNDLAVTNPGMPGNETAKRRGKTLTGSLEPNELKCLQTILLEKATGKRPIPLVNLDEEYSKVSSLINQTVTAGESNSMLLLGSRGSGKTALVNRIIQEQTAQNPNDFHVVRLNGFVHTDDKIALREIWRQLGREMELDTEQNISKNYADALTTLLALLSHPVEMGRDEPGQITKSVIFVLDEFQLFAHHPRQTLLYNLFDIAQSRKAPIAVIGLTTNIDVVEILEKRVKSRFSHRYVYLSLAKSFHVYEQMCKSAISITLEELTVEEKARLRLKSDVGAQLKNASSKVKLHTQSCLTKWNELAEQILCTSTVEEYLRRIYYTTKSIPEFLASTILPLAQIPVTSSKTLSEILDHFETSFSLSSLKPPDSKLSYIESLSMLQLALLVCAARLSTIFETEHISFALAYEEYKTLASKAKLQASASGSLAQGAGSRVFSKDVAKSAWEELLHCGLVMEDGRTANGGRVDVGLEEIGMSGVELGPWARWCREI